MAEKNDKAGIKPLERKTYAALKKEIKRFMHGYALAAALNPKKSSEEYNFNILWLQSELKSSILPVLKILLMTAYQQGYHWFFKAYEKKTGIKLPKLPINPTTINHSVSQSLQYAKNSLNDISVQIEEGKFNNDQEVRHRLLEFAVLTALTLPITQKVWGACDNAKSNEIKSFSFISEGEYLTVGDLRVCYRCRRYDGEILDIDMIRSLIPMHPRCRCWFRLTD